MNIIVMLLGAVIVFIVISLVYRRYWDKNLTAKLKLNNDYATMGDYVELIETVANDKLLPLPYLNLKFQTDRKLVFNSKDTNTVISDKAYRNDIFSVMGRQRVTRRIPLLCSGRGVFNINELQIISTGAFMKDTFIKKQEQSISLTVYPKPADVSQFEVLFNSMIGAIEKKKYLYEDKFVFRGIRDYDYSDSMNDINWKATARTGNLCVNQYNETTSQMVTIFLNLENEGMNRDDKKFEACISIAAGLVQEFIEKGIKTQLLSNGLSVDTGDITKVMAGAGRRHYETINRALAYINAEGKVADFVGLLKDNKDMLEKESLSIMISLDLREQVQEQFNIATENAKDSYWIVPVYRGEGHKLNKSYAKLVEWTINRN